MVAPEPRDKTVSTPCLETGGLESSLTAKKLVRTHGGDVVVTQEAKTTEKLNTITEKLLEAGKPKATPVTQGIKKLTLGKASQKPKGSGSKKMMLKLLRQQSTLEERLGAPVFQPPQLKPNPQLTPLSEIETYGDKPTLKLNPEKVEKRVKTKLRGPRSKRIEEMKTLTPWESHPETPAKTMKLRGRDKPAQAKPEEKTTPRQASAAQEPAKKKSKVTFNEADFMQPLNV